MDRRGAGHSGDRESDTVGRWMDPWRPYMIALTLINVGVGYSSRITPN